MRWHIIGNPPQRVESVFYDRSHPELLCHVDLRWQQTRSFDFPVQQSRETRAKAADIYWLDALKWKVFLESVGNVEMTSCTHPHCNRDVFEVLRLRDFGIRSNKNPPR